MHCLQYVTVTNNPGAQGYWSAALTVPPIGKRSGGASILPEP
jgi:hypothetical protein